MLVNIHRVGFDLELFWGVLCLVKLVSFKAFSSMNCVYKDSSELLGNWFFLVRRRVLLNRFHHLQMVSVNIMCARTEFYRLVLS